MEAFKESIKDVERLKRGAVHDEMGTFIITGAEQQQQKKGNDLLKSGTFKEALAKFLKSVEDSDILYNRKRLFW